MWKKLKTWTEHPIAQFLKKVCGDPVQMYAVFLMTTIMYYYHDRFAWLYTIVTIFVAFILMKFYDFVAKKGVLGALSYIVYFFAGMYGVFMITNLGQQSYPISFGVWFLTPQSVVDFSMYYTLSIYLLMTGFLTSAVYYFAKVRYRMTMQFLIMLIPLSLYGKEGIHMPALLVILLLSSYFLLMIYCRQLRDNEHLKNLPSFQSGASIAVYVMAFSIISAIIPKPSIQADREFIENAMSYSTWSDVLMNAISMFTESTDNSVGSSNNARTLFSANASESLRLRTQTYSYYYDDDSWNASDYDRPTLEYEAPLTYKPQELLQTIVNAATADPDFAEKYGLSEFAGTTLPEQPEYQFFIYSWYQIRVLPIPTRTKQLTSKISDSYGTTNTTINAQMSPTKAIYPNAYYGMDMTYYPDTYARYSAVLPILKNLEHDTYYELLHDAQQILKDDENAVALLQEVQREVVDADMLLNQTNENDFQSEVVDTLAKEITDGLHSDMEKALAIERYFTDMGYIYDSSFQKEQGDNVETFLTTSHTGVCYEYATAMTLLCRSAGLPTRYVQGYNMGEQYNSSTRSYYNRDNYRETNFVIKARDAHAFPEVYISGYGWLSFEPTVAGIEVNATAENKIIQLWGYVFLGIAVIIFIIWLALPEIRERIFRRRIKTMSAQECASSVFKRMRWQLKLQDSTTVTELQEKSAPFFTEENFFSVMDVLLYEPAPQAGNTVESLALAYIRWQDGRKTFEKEQRRQRKEKLNTHVTQTT